MCYPTHNEPHLSPSSLIWLRHFLQTQRKQSPRTRHEAFRPPVVFGKQSDTWTREGHLEPLRRDV